MQDPRSGLTAPSRGCRSTEQIRQATRPRSVPAACCMQTPLSFVCTPRQFAIIGGPRSLESFSSDPTAPVAFSLFEGGIPLVQRNALRCLSTRLGGASLAFLVCFAALLPTAAASAADSNSFAGLKFGAGVSWTGGTGDDRIQQAEVVEGIVRVSAEDSDRLRVVLESHYFFQVASRVGHGPFVALQPGSDEIIEALGFGWMVGLRRKSGEDEVDKSSSWNIGLGAIVDQNVLKLGDGIVRNEPLPNSETTIRTKTDADWGFLVVSSFTWSS